VYLPILVYAQVRWFGNLLLTNAARWETTHFPVKCLYRATRRHTRTLGRCLTKVRVAEERSQWPVAASQSSVAVAEDGGSIDSEGSDSEGSDRDMGEQQEQEPPPPPGSGGK